MNVRVRDGLVYVHHHLVVVFYANGQRDKQIFDRYILQVSWMKLLLNKLLLDQLL